MKKLIILFFLISTNAWSVSCTEGASFAATFKLQDMLSTYGEQYFYELNNDKDFIGFVGNVYDYDEVCKNDNIESVLTYLKRENFKFCTLEKVAESLSISLDSNLKEERAISIVSPYVEAEGCSQEVITKLEDNIVEASRLLEEEILKPKFNITLACRFVQKALSKNYELRKTCGGGVN